MTLSAAARLLPTPLRATARHQLVRWRHVGLRTDDVLLVSYPKSGSTWLRFLLAHTLTSADSDFDSVRDTVPPLDRYRRAPALLPGGGRLVRSHEPLAPYRGRDGQRVISLVRDGRDVALSYLAHERRYGRFDGEPGEFIDRFLAGRVDPYGPWHEHVLAAIALEESGRAQVLQVRYEDLQARTVEELARILAFCGVDHRDPAAVPLEEVVERNGKDQMRAKESTSAFLATMHTDGTPFVRPERRERWDDLVSGADRARFERVCGPALAAAGYPLREHPWRRGDVTADAAEARLDFVVVGAQRSATTHLNACLRSHPEIFMCRDEVPYFEHPFFETSDPSELTAALAGASAEQLRGIQRPDYLARPECAGNIRSAAPDVRILAVLRDPVARAISAYHWYLQFGLLPLVPLDEGIERLLDGWTDPAHPRAHEIVELGFYGRHLQRYLDAFGADQVLVLLGDDLRDPTTFPRLFRFLGVDERHVPRAAGRPTNAGTYDLRRLRVLRLRSRFAWSWDDVTEYTFRPRRLRRPIASVVSAAVVGFDRVVLARALGAASPVALRPDLERRLRHVYAEDVQRLETMLGRDLQRWHEGAPLSPSS